MSNKTHQLQTNAPGQTSGCVLRHSQPAVAVPNPVVVAAALCGQHEKRPALLALALAALALVALAASLLAALLLPRFLDQLAAASAPPHQQPALPGTLACLLAWAFPSQLRQSLFPANAGPLAIVGLRTIARAYCTHSLRLPPRAVAVHALCRFGSQRALAEDASAPSPEARLKRSCAGSCPLQRKTGAV